MARFRLGPWSWSLFIWWLVIGISLGQVINATGLGFTTTGQPRSIWSFIAIPIFGVAIFPFAYLLDRVLTPKLRRSWAAWRLAQKAGGGR